VMTGSILRFVKGFETCHPLRSPRSGRIPSGK
jgi:hypothetical protein